MIAVIEYTVGESGVLPDPHPPETSPVVSIIEEVFGMKSTLVELRSFVQEKYIFWEDLTGIQALIKPG